MTLGQAIDKSRRLARVDVTGKLDSEVMDCINEAMKAFAKRAKHLIKNAYLDVVPLFDVNENMAINIAITGGTNAIAATDIAITAADALGISGTVLAGYLQAQIRAAIGVGANLTVSWSTTEWKFTIDSIDGTDITVSAPSAIIYSDASQIIGISGTKIATSFQGGFPQDCTVVVSMPSDFVGLKCSPEWDGDELYESPVNIFTSPEVFGEPTRYYILGDTMKLYPSPTRQGRLHIIYKYFPAEFERVSGYQECGLAGITNMSDTGLSTETQYYFKAAIDGGAITEYDITTGTDVSYNAVVALINAELSGATFSIVDGDLRCSSDSESQDSQIYLAAGTTGDDLFAALTGFVDFEAGVLSQYTTDIPIDDDYCMAIVSHTAAQLLEESFEVKLSDRHYAQFELRCSEYNVEKANQNTSIFPKRISRNLWRVDPDASS